MCYQEAKNWFLHDNNWYLVTELSPFVGSSLKHNIISFLHPLFTPNVAAAGFHLFSKMKTQLNSVVEIKSESLKILDSLTENDSQTGFQKW